MQNDFHHWTQPHCTTSYSSEDAITSQIVKVNIKTAAESKVHQTARNLVANCITGVNNSTINNELPDLLSLEQMVFVYLQGALLYGITITGTTDATER